jgi:hypothetical protein
VRTQLGVFLEIPLIEVEVEELQPMEVRCMADEPGDAVWCREYPLARLEVFKPKAVEVQWVKTKLAGPVVGVPVEGIDSHPKAETLGLRTQGAWCNSGTERAPDVRANHLVFRECLEHFIDDSKTILCTGDIQYQRETKSKKADSQLTAATHLSKNLDHSVTARAEEHSRLLKNLNSLLRERVGNGPIVRAWDDAPKSRFRGSRAIPSGNFILENIDLLCSDKIITFEASPVSETRAVDTFDRWIAIHSMEACRDKLRLAIKLWISEVRTTNNLTLAHFVSAGGTTIAKAPIRTIAAERLICSLPNTAEDGEVHIEHGGELVPEVQGIC